MSVVKSPGDEVITIVDVQDNPVTAKTRSEMRRHGGVYRVTYILVFNNLGELLVQTRTDIKDWCPGRLDLAAGGIVQADESYNISAQRELHEELGVTAKLESCFKSYYEDTSVCPVNQNWGAVYTCVSNGPFVLQASEVAAIEFLQIEAVLALPKSMVTPDTRQVFLSWLMMQ